MRKRLPLRLQTTNVKFQNKKPLRLNAYLTLGLVTGYDRSTSIVALDVFQLPSAFDFFHHVRPVRTSPRSTSQRIQFLHFFRREWFVSWWMKLFDHYIIHNNFSKIVLQVRGLLVIFIWHAHNNSCRQIKRTRVTETEVTNIIIYR